MVSREQINLRQRLWRKNNKRRFLELNKASRLRHPQEVKHRDRRRVWRSHGFTETEGLLFVAGHNSSCDICGKSCTLASSNLMECPCIDHDHRTGSSRGLLCYFCNRGLGLFQDNKCAVCTSSPPEYKSLAVDHDHTTTQIRGLLCSKCNQGVGQFKDCTDLLARAMEYLQEYKCY